LNVDKLISEYLKLNVDSTINNEYIRNNIVCEKTNTLSPGIITNNIIININQTNEYTKFVNDFSSLVDNNTSSTNFVINIDTVAKWLNSKKFTLKETLKKSYILGKDYNIYMQSPKNVGRPQEIVLLTHNCFKRLCMLSRTKKAEEIRSYFIELESHSDKNTINSISELTNTSS